MDQASAAIERRGCGDCRFGHGEDVGIFDCRARRRTNIMPVTEIVMVRDALVRIRRHLVDVAGGMNGKLNARDASPHQIGGMSHAGEAGENQHQACQERQKGSHQLIRTTERLPCHCNNSRASDCAARHAGQAKFVSQIRFATSATLPTPSIKSDAGGTPFAILSAISKMTAAPRVSMIRLSPAPNPLH